MKYEKINNFKPPSKRLQRKDFPIGAKVKILDNIFIGDMSKGKIVKVIRYRSYGQIECDTLDDKYEGLGLGFWPNQIKLIE